MSSTWTLSELQTGLRTAGYVSAPHIDMALFLALALQKPILVEGPVGVGKTELAKAAAKLLGSRLIRLQCYEGLDESHALYEWNYQKQLLRLQSDSLRGATWSETERDIFSREYLLPRPLLSAITSPTRVVLLIDEVDRADEEFEAFLLELLGELQVTIPELGTLRAEHSPLVLLTSNRARELSEALRRRCLHLPMELPDSSRELEILRLRVPELDEQLRLQAAKFVANLRAMALQRSPSLAESVDWCRALAALGARELDRAIAKDTLGLLVKLREDREKAARAVEKLPRKADTP
ncbi:MAG: MoxR family ATPase [Candidatus Schekmanbacteria bacterium]|nr:MoxR family ATPase [Candidatus Schekmanbacteria bacterium]